MSVEIRLPRLGQSMTEAEIRSWVVPAGSPVRAGQVVLRIETDKAEYELEAPADGVLGAPLVEAGVAVPVGTLLAHVLMPGEMPAAAAAAAAPRASPRARARARELGLDLAALRGSGPDGLIVARDVEGAVLERSAWQGRAVRERRPLSRARATAARRLAAAWTAAPQFVQVVDVDFSRALELRARWRQEPCELGGVTLTHLAIAALGRALAAHPDLNAAYDSGTLVVLDEVNVGFAVDSPQGLLVPVIRAADRTPLAEIAARARVLAQQARNGSIEPASLDGGTATLSNLGAWGVRSGTPVLNPPESVLAFLGSVEPRPAVIGGALGIRPLGALSIAFDHRVTDGAAAARFTAAVKRGLEDPESLG